MAAHAWRLVLLCLGARGHGELIRVPDADASRHAYGVVVPRIMAPHAPNDVASYSSRFQLLCAGCLLVLSNGSLRGPSEEGLPLRWRYSSYRNSGGPLVQT